MKKLLLNSKPINHDLGLLILRLFVAITMLASHGWGKMMKLIAGDTGFADVFGMGETASLILAVFAEVLCSLFLALGLFTRASLIPLIITMLVAVFVIHGDDPFGKKEFGLLYLIPYITLLLTGPGKYSLDKQISKA